MGLINNTFFKAPFGEFGEALTIKGLSVVSKT